MKKWLLVIRSPFLALAVVLAFLGNCIAWHFGAFNWGYALLTGFGLLLAHISVNVFNEYFDYKSGIDLETVKTPFSGGSGALPSGIVSPREALWLGLATLLVIVPIGIYFVVVQGWLLLPLLLVAAVCIVFYSPVILKWGWPEWAPGVGLGFLPVMGVYFAQSGEYTWPVAIAAVPSGILVHNLLLLNEFPDVEADKKTGRKTTPITMGGAAASKFYVATTVLVYVWIIGAVIAGQMPVFSLLALLTLPIAIKAIGGALKYDDPARLVPAMASNVLVVLITQFLLGIGYILARVF
ncbi:MAG: prenyltransferase [Dehalococcoidales bacterium]|nr:MAG: prenyltransferase [Dehalococcoidales bacterium]